MEGGGRCRRVLSTGCTIAAEWRAGTPPPIRTGGAIARADGLRSPLALPLASVILPQSGWQSLLVTAGPEGLSAPRFLEHDLPCSRQQEQFDSLNIRAPSGAREANDNSRLRHIAQARRITRK